MPVLRCPLCGCEALDLSQTEDSCSPAICGQVRCGGCDLSLLGESQIRCIAARKCSSRSWDERAALRLK